MKIAINLWVLKDQHKEGIGWFTFYTVDWLIKQHPDVEFCLLVSANFNRSQWTAPNVSYHTVFPNKRHPALYILYLHYIVPQFLKKIKPDLFFSPDGMLSTRASCPQVPVIHDINFVHYPRDSKWRNRWYYNRYFPRYARLAKRIATVSDYSRQDIARQFQVSVNKIDVVYCGLNEFFTAAGSPSPVDVIPADKPYFVFVGSVNPRKNLARLIQAFDMFRASGREATLVIAGASGWLLNDVKAAYDTSTWKQDIIFTGRLSNEQLKTVLSEAMALAFVPYFEGFGIPLIEAMACNIPVIASDITSLPEIAGNAAVYVNPFKPAEIAEAMCRLFDSPALREQLMENGKKRLPTFTWEQTAQRVWQCILSATQ